MSVLTLISTPVAARTAVVSLAWAWATAVGLRTPPAPETLMVALAPVAIAVVAAAVVVLAAVVAAAFEDVSEAVGSATATLVVSADAVTVTVRVFVTVVGTQSTAEVVAAAV